MEEFDNYAIDIDGDCLSNDFDDYDLYGERMEEDSSDDFGNNLILD